MAKETYTYIISFLQVKELQCERLNTCITLHYDDSDSKESACNAGDLGLIPGSGRSPGEGNDNPLQYSWLENSTDKGAWQAIVCGVAIAIMLHDGIGIEISWLSWRSFLLHNSISVFYFTKSSFIYLFTLKNIDWP